MRRCGKRFVLLAAEGVLIRWDCDAEKVVDGELAVDVEYLADHTADIAHHHHHLTHKENP